MLLFSSFPSLVSGKGEGDGLSGDGGGQAIFVSTHLQLSTTTLKTINNNNNKKCTHLVGGLCAFGTRAVWSPHSKNPKSVLTCLCYISSVFSSSNLVCSFNIFQHSCVYKSVDSIIVALISCFSIWFPLFTSPCVQLLCV